MKNTYFPFEGMNDKDSTLTENVMDEIVNYEYKSKGVLQKRVEQKDYDQTILVSEINSDFDDIIKIPPLPFYPTRKPTDMAGDFILPVFGIQGGAYKVVLYYKTENTRTKSKLISVGGANYNQNSKLIFKYIQDMMMIFDCDGDNPIVYVMVDTDKQLIADLLSNITGSPLRKILIEQSSNKWAQDPDNYADKPGIFRWYYTIENEYGDESNPSPASDIVDLAYINIDEEGVESEWVESVELTNLKVPDSLSKIAKQQAKYFNIYRQRAEYQDSKVFTEPQFVKQILITDISDEQTTVDTVSVGEASAKMSFGNEPPPVARDGEVAGGSIILTHIKTKATQTGNFDIVIPINTTNPNNETYPYCPVRIAFDLQDLQKYIPSPIRYNGSQLIVEDKIRILDSDLISPLPVVYDDSQSFDTEDKPYDEEDFPSIETEDWTSDSWTIEDGLAKANGAGYIEANNSDWNVDIYIQITGSMLDGISVENGYEQAEYQHTDGMRQVWQRDNSGNIKIVSDANCNAIISSVKVYKRADEDMKLIVYTDIPFLTAGQQRTIFLCYADSSSGVVSSWSGGNSRLYGEWIPYNIKNNDDNYVLSWRQRVFRIPPLRRNAIFQFEANDRGEWPLVNGYGNNITGTYYKAKETKNRANSSITFDQDYSISIASGIYIGTMMGLLPPKNDAESFHFLDCYKQKNPNPGIKIFDGDDEKLTSLPDKFTMYARGNIPIVEEAIRGLITNDDYWNYQNGDIDYLVIHIKEEEGLRPHDQGCNYGYLFDPAVWMYANRQYYGRITITELGGDEETITSSYQYFSITHPAAYIYEYPEFSIVARIEDIEIEEFSNTSYADNYTFNIEICNFRETNEGYGDENNKLLRTYMAEYFDEEIHPTVTYGPDNTYHNSGWIYIYLEDYDPTSWLLEPGNLVLFKFRVSYGGNNHWYWLWLHRDLITVENMGDNNNIIVLEVEGSHLFDHDVGAGLVAADINEVKFFVYTDMHHGDVPIFKISNDGQTWKLSHWQFGRSSRINMQAGDLPILYSKQPNNLTLRDNIFMLLSVNLSNDSIYVFAYSSSTGDYMSVDFADVNVNSTDDISDWIEDMSDSGDIYFGFSYEFFRWMSQAGILEESFGKDDVNALINMANHMIPQKQGVIGYKKDEDSENNNIIINYGDMVSGNVIEHKNKAMFSKTLGYSFPATNMKIADEPILKQFRFPTTLAEMSNAIIWLMRNGYTLFMAQGDPAKWSDASDIDIRQKQQLGLLAEDTACVTSKGIMWFSESGLVMMQNTQPEIVSRNFDIPLKSSYTHWYCPYREQYALHDQDFVKITGDMDFSGSTIETDDVDGIDVGDVIIISDTNNNNGYHKVTGIDSGGTRAHQITVETNLNTESDILATIRIPQSWVFELDKGVSYKYRSFDMKSYTTLSGGNTKENLMLVITQNNELKIFPDYGEDRSDTDAKAFIKKTIKANLTDFKSILLRCENEAELDARVIDSYNSNDDKDTIEGITINNQKAYRLPLSFVGDKLVINITDGNKIQYFVVDMVNIKSPFE